MQLLPATPDDAERLFAWRNDPLTRAFSRNRQAVPWPDHLAWLERLFRDADRKLLMVVDSGTPVGMVRFDRNGAAWELSWTIAPEQRGRGLGRAALGRAVAQATAILRQDAVLLRAEVFVENAASAAMAAAAGFRMVRREGDLTVWERHVSKKAVMTLDGREIGPGMPPYVIAEMSGNHNGDINRAFAIIEAAKVAGADAVKLQTYTADTMTIDHDGPGFRIQGGLWDGRTLYDLYQEAGTPWAWHEALFARGRELGITVFSSPFDASAVTFLEGLGAPAYKIASFELVDLPLIRRVATTGKPMILSTGMASLAEIGEAVATARAGGCQDPILLHCVSGYPSPAGEANLRTLVDLSERFDLLTGLSDHSAGVAVAVAAVALGAVVVEKHVTLSRADGGTDAAFSLEPAELAALVRECGTAWSALGTIHYERTASELGNAVFRRSLYIVEDVAEGEVLTSKNVRAIRPGYGLPPKHLDQVLNRRAVRPLRRGEPLTMAMVAEDPAGGQKPG